MREIRIIDRPEPGFWATRMRRGGVEVGSAILRVQTQHEPDDPENEMDRSPFLVGFLNGRLVDWFDVWTRKGRPISERDYHYLLADRAWAAQHATDLPEANPTRRADLGSMAPLF